MERQLTPDEILEVQRIEATKVYAEKVATLRVQANELEAKCKDLQETINEAISQKQSELNSLIEELKNKIFDVEKKETDLKMLFRDAQAKNDMANKLAENTLANKSAHQEAVEMHLSSAQQERESLATRHNICLEREETAEIKMRDANNRLEIAIKKEEEVGILISNLNILKSNTDLLICAQQELELKNTETQEIIFRKLEEFSELKKNADFERGEFNKACAEFESNRTSLNNRKIDIDRRENELKQATIKNSVDAQRLQERQKDLDYREGKLNELKNNVDALMKLQESKI